MMGGHLLEVLARMNLLYMYILRIISFPPNHFMDWTTHCVERRVNPPDQLELHSIDLHIHQDNMSVYFIPPYIPLLQSKTGVYRGIHYFLIFAIETL